jgi:hypothetical protein
MSEFSDRERERLRKEYETNPRSNSFKALVTGESGTGKTHLLRTARTPVHIDSFDPGGTKVLRDLIDRGDIIADTEYEQEDPLSPTKFIRWTVQFETRLKHGYFDDIATYCLDSSTLWNEAIMNQQLKSTNRAGQAPKWQVDYTPQKVAINNYMTKILSLPCDVIVTGHLSPEYETRMIAGEEVKSLTGYRYMTTGQARELIPLKFDEIYVTLVEPGRGMDAKPSYKLLTGIKGLYLAKTRIGRGKFDLLEESNIKSLLAKANWNSSGTK